VAAAQPQLKRRAWVAFTAALAAMSVSACGDVGGRQARERPARIPAAVEQQVHRTLHRLPRVCSRRRTDVAAIDRITTAFVAWYRRYPADRYEMQIDDERGTMLSAILVLRYELAKCSPRHAARIDPVLPPKVRAGLTPLRARGGS
jgi:hypothetical protein